MLQTLCGADIAPQSIVQFGGYPMLIQGPDEESSPDWPFLLQISSDYELGWMWGDWGRLYFWTQPRGAHQLGPVCSVMECY